MTPQFFRCSKVVRASFILALAASTISCSRSHSFDRVARRRRPMPPPPVVIEGPDSTTDLPLSLPPTDTMPGSRNGAAYGLPGISVAPLGSTGSSRDIRYPQLRGPRARAIIVEPPAIPSTKPAQADRAPQAMEQPITVPSAPERNDTVTKANGRSEEAPSELAPGIPRYSIIEPNVATGGQPTYEGMQWLKDRGFQTVLNLLPDDEADPAESGMVRQLGLDYITLPVTAATINTETVNRFNEVVDDAKYRPLFIHDSTGSRTGALWYLHRVTVDKVPDDRARNQAARIGLKDTDTELWLAIQRYLVEAD